MGVFLLELHTLNSHLYFSWFLWFLERSLIESYSYFPAERVSSLIIFFLSSLSLLFHSSNIINLGTQILVYIVVTFPITVSKY